MLEALEPRLLLSTDQTGLLWTELGAAADDASDRFAWSGWLVQQDDDAKDAGDAAGIAEFRYVFPAQPQLEVAPAGYQVVMAGEDSWTSAGDPVVPSRTSHILLPQGMQIASVSVSLGTGTVLATGVDLLAAPTPVPFGSEAQVVYETVSESFHDAVTFETQFLKGYSIGAMNVLPVAYDMATGTVTYYDQIELTITAGPVQTADVLPVRDSLADAQYILELVDNDSAAAQYAPADSGVQPLSGTLPPAGPYEYVIVTPNAFASAFQPLVDHKISRGLTATIVTTQYISANYSSPYAGENDLAGKVREFITDAYLNWDTQWVVLAGDTDVTNAPYRYVKVSANGETETFLTDMYFACLDGPYNYTSDSDWGQVNDGAGGGDVDRAPEVFVGRFSAGTAAEVTNLVNKTILYETTAPPNPTTGLWLGEKLSDDPKPTGTWGGDSCEAIITEAVPADYTAVKLYEKVASYTAAAVKAQLNASPNFVEHLGHANWNLDAMLVPADPPLLTNEHPYLFYSQGCISGAFQYSDCMAEAHTVKAPNAAFAAIMNTHYGWYTPGGLGGSHDWALGFFDALFNEHLLHVGQAHFDSKMEEGSASGTGRWVFFACTLFGDPETPMFLPLAEGPTITASTPQGQTTGPVSSLRLEFSEPMDRSSFDIDDIVSFTGPGGFDLSDQVTGFRWWDFWTLDVLFQEQTGLGTYRMVLGPGVLDYDGTAMDADGDGISGESVEDRLTIRFRRREPAGEPSVLYQADMSTNPGWTLQSQWAYGKPTGASTDPSSGHTGNNVLGYNLSGAYANSMASTRYATSPTIACSQMVGVTLSFWRWLGVEDNSWDHATIDVSSDGGATWVNVWENGSTTINETAWSQQVLDVSAVADLSGNVKIRFGMGPTDDNTNYGGWNIDDLAVTGSPAYPTLFSHTPRVSDAGVDHVDVTFANPIDSGTFGTGDVQIAGPGGPVTPLSVTLVAGSTYRIRFDEQSALGTYTLTVGPHIKGLSGYEMDQDADGTPGEEAQDAYVGGFQILAPDTDSPFVTSHTPSGLATAPVSKLTFTFDEAMDTASFALADIAGFNGPAGSLAAALTGFCWQDPATLEVYFQPREADGLYTMTLATSITDEAPGQNPLAQSYSGLFRLGDPPPNSDPVIDTLTGDAQGSEGATLGFSASVHDADGAEQSLDYTWNFGDGSPEVSGIDLSSVSHVYADDGSYIVSLTVDDGFGGTDSSTLPVEVANAAPVVDAGEDRTASGGRIAYFIASFTDAGTLDTHTATIDWGDGTPLALGVVAEWPFGPPGSTGGMSGTVSASHVYTTAALYTVTVTVTDDNGGAAADTLDVTVNPGVLSPVIVVGHHLLSPDAAGQQILINLTGGDLVEGLNFNIQVADGGPEAADLGFAVPPGIDGPTIQDLDILTGTIFASNNTGQVDPEGAPDPLPQFEIRSTTTASGTVSADGLLATVTIDTRGFSSGTWGLFMANTLNSATDFAGVAANIADGTITISTPPVANAGGPYAVAEGASVALDAWASYDPEAPLDRIVLYEWDLDADGIFGETGIDAAGGDELGVSPTFSAAGLDGPDTWTVYLRVTDTTALVSSIATADVNIANVAPTAQAGEDQAADEGDLVSFSGSFTDPGADTHTIEWSFGDGGSASGSLTPSHVYADNGVYTVTLTVTDDDGGVGTDTLEVTVSNAAPVVDAGADQTANEGQTVNLSATFTDAGSADRHTATIDWGDGTAEPVDPASSPLTPSHAYADNGTYTVTVTVADDDGGGGVDTLTVTVGNVAPVVDAGADAAIDEGDTFTGSGSFTDPGSDTWTATVDYGDGGGAQALALNLDKTFGLSHVYADNGDYTVTVTVSDDDGASHSDALTVTVSNVAPLAEAGEDQAADEGALVSFAGSFTDPGADTHTIEWSFGDGGSASGSLTPSHAYADNGVYTVTLTVTDDDGGVGVDTLTVTVRNVAPVVDAGPDAAIDEGDTFTGSGSFTDPGADAWTATVDYGDGGGAQALVLNPDKTFGLSHVYADDGEYTVTVTVTDDDSTVHSDALTVTVSNVAPVVDAGPDASIDEGDTFTGGGSFTDPGADTWTATVDYGDGGGAQAFALNLDKTFGLSHVYADNGDYTVTVTVTDDDDASHSDALTVTVSNVAPLAEVGADHAADEGGLVSFAGSFTDPGADTHTIEWSFGDGGSASGSLTPSHVYADNGVYTVTLTVTDDDGGIGADALTVTVGNVAPVIQSMSLPPAKVHKSHPVNVQVEFTDVGAGDTHTAEIDWGDGTAVQVVDPAASPVIVDHFYSAQGTYTVTVTVRDDDGGEDFDTGTVEVTEAEVVGRHIFYNHSAWDGNDAAANATDDVAIASDKVALRPGGTAKFENYTSYSRGINGIMVDIDTPAGTVSVDDFLFRVGNNNTPDTWAAAPVLPSVTVRPGAGVGGSDRVTLVWPDGAIAKQWLQVTVLVTDNTGLPADDVFYFGNAVGEAGNSTADAFVNATDEIQARNNPHYFANPAPIDDPYDYDRNKKVDATDQIIARSNPTYFLTALRLITVPGSPAGLSKDAPAAEPATALPLSVTLAGPGQGATCRVEWTAQGQDGSLAIWALGPTGWQAIADQVPQKQGYYEWAPGSDEPGWYCFAARGEDQVPLALGAAADWVCVSAVGTTHVPAAGSPDIVLAVPLAMAAEDDADAAPVDPKALSSDLAGAPVTLDGAAPSYQPAPLGASAAPNADAETADDPAAPGDDGLLVDVLQEPDVL